MHIDWAALFKVAGVSFAFGVGVVVVFSVGLLALGSDAPDSAGTVSAAGAASPGRKLTAGVCLLLSAAAALYGVWLIVPQFHR